MIMIEKIIIDTGKQINNISKLEDTNLNFNTNHNYNI